MDNFWREKQRFGQRPSVIYNFWIKKSFRKDRGASDYVITGDN